MRLFDNRLSVNAALFHEVIKGIHATTLDPSSPVIVTRFLNAGKLKTRGFEGEAIWAVTPELRLNGSLAYVKGTYDDLLLGCIVAQTMTGTCPNFEGRMGVQDGTGLPAIRAPNWTYLVGGGYADDVGRDVRFFAGARRTCSRSW